jgi:hypothetical protein
MDKIRTNKKYMGIFGILLFGMSIITLGKHNISKLFTTPLGRIWLLFLLIGTSISNYKLGCVLLILILLLHSYLSTVEGMDTLNKSDASSPTPPTKKAATPAPPASATPVPAPTSAPASAAYAPPNINPKMEHPDENKKLQGEGGNLLDIERNITKNSNSLPVSSKQNTENVLPSNPGKEAFQSNYQLL